MNSKYTINYLWLICFVFLASCYGLFSPVLNSNDAYFYALISKNIVINHDWINLTYLGHDWLDKPHFPFWATAISYKIFGINPFSYAIIGFLFDIIGAIYTYRLAKMFFNTQTASLATLIYFSCLRLMLSAIDIRAEAFLLGEILPACFYLWRYDVSNRFKHLFLASFFTALALMTKGLFVLVTICSGQLFYWFYTKQLVRKLFTKLLIFLCMAFVCALPEFICLYLQFDAHPEKIIFGVNNVSGIEWYFWGSQFGRFFNSGPIVNKHGDPLFFVHTFLWAFLPWTILFISSVIQIIKSRSKLLHSDWAKLSYLFVVFAITFLLFSATKFQLDYYTNIIFPFAAIICAFSFYTSNCYHWYLITQNVINVLLLLINLVLIVFIFKVSIYLSIIVMPILFLYLYYKKRKDDLAYLAVTFATLAISSIFITLMYININIYPKYNTGLNLRNYLDQQQGVSQVYLLNTDKTYNTFNFYSNKFSALEIESLNGITFKNSYLLVDNSSQKEAQQIANSRLVMTFLDIPLEKFVPTLLSANVYNRTVRSFYLYKID